MVLTTTAAATPQQQRMLCAHVSQKWHVDNIYIERVHTCDACSSPNPPM